MAGSINDSNRVGRDAGGQIPDFPEIAGRIRNFGILNCCCNAESASPVNENGPQLFCTAKRFLA
jgi:hypothetical protein